MGYYMGDYYKGDPGIGSFLGGLFKSAVSSFVPGGGAITKVVSTVASAATKGRGVIMAGGKIALRHPVLTGAAAAGAVAAGGAAAEHALLGAGGLPPKGYHRCKSKHGCKRGEFVRNRRMNPCNVRALRRAARRAGAFLKISRRLVGHFQARKPKGRGYIKHKRKAK